MAKKQQKQETNDDRIIKRLDALLRMLIETSKSRAKEKFTEATAARLLWSVGLTPTEIARILGKPRASDVSKYLYSTKKKKSPVRMKESDAGEVAAEEGEK